MIPWSRGLDRNRDQAVFYIESVEFYDLYFLVRSRDIMFSYNWNTCLLNGDV